jgi:diguanylate cyclase (GGDEF)-like protein
MRIWLIALLSICAIAAAVLVASETQRTAAQENFVEAETANDLHADILEQSQRVSDFIEGRREGFVANFRIEARGLHTDLRTARDLSSDDPVEIAQLDRQENASVRWHGLARRDVSRERRGLSLLSRHLDQRDQLLDAFVAANAQFRHRLSVNRQEELHAAALVPVRLVIGLGLLFGAIAFLFFRRQRRTALAREGEQERHAAVEAAFVDSQARFGEALQVAQDQSEAHLLLKRHLEERIPGSSVVVLNRNNSANRLEPSEQLSEDDPLAKALAHAEPRSCLAVRLSRHYERGSGEAEILPCDLCGSLESCSTCQPLLVGGEVIGSVLVEHRSPLDSNQRRQCDESVTKAAPVLANLRNLSIAQRQAVTDSLTGLPNKRAFDDAFKRMLAQAGRNLSPLSVLLLDLDRFKQVNDAYGHERGDEVLAALGALLRAQLRAGDFPARYGGEEFIVLLPDTARSGAMKIADELRRSLHALKISELTSPVTASFGVSTFPDDSTDPDHLIRTADRALYAAKQNGRDRVETVSKGDRDDESAGRQAEPARAGNGAAAS